MQSMSENRSEIRKISQTPLNRKKHISWLKTTMQGATIYWSYQWHLSP